MSSKSFLTGVPCLLYLDIAGTNSCEIWILEKSSLTGMSCLWQAGLYAHSGKIHVSMFETELKELTGAPSS
jgi:hypothetical protein